MVKPVVIDLVAYSTGRMTSPLSTPVPWQVPLSDFTRWMRGADYPRSTQDKRLYHLRRFAVSTQLDPWEATTEQLLDYLGRHQWSAATKRSVRSTLRAFYSWAHADGRLDHDPAALLPKITQPPGTPRPTPEHIVREALATAGERERLMILLAATASLRCCEICLVHVRDIIGGRGDYSLVVHGKGRKDRVVPIADSLARELRERGVRNGGWVFEGQIDGHLSNKRVIELLADALPGEWTGHTLRHRFASVAYQASGDIRAVQELLGHASVATTQIYTAIGSDARRVAAMAAAVA